MENLSDELYGYVVYLDRESSQKERKDLHGYIRNSSSRIFLRLNLSPPTAVSSNRFFLLIPKLNSISEESSTSRRRCKQSELWRCRPELAYPGSCPWPEQWKKGKLIGRGTFGSVYVASNSETGALCAMKEVELFPDDLKSAECIKQLDQEIKLLSNLQHPNIVQYYGSETVEERFFIYLEYLHPGSINKYICDHCGGTMTESVVRNSLVTFYPGWLIYTTKRQSIDKEVKPQHFSVTDH